MQSAYRRVIVIAVLTAGIFAGCQEGRKITEMRDELAKVTAERDKLAAQNDSVNANFERLRKENEELKAQLTRK